MRSKISGEPGAMKLAYTDSEGKKRNLTVDYVIMATGTARTSASNTPRNHRFRFIASPFLF